MTPRRAVHKYPYDLFATQIVEAGETELTVVYKNLRGTSESVYKYGDVASRTSLTRGGQAGWKRPAAHAFFLSVIGFIMAKSPAWYIASGILGVVAVTFYAASFARYNWQSFYLVSREYLFSLVLPDDAELAGYIVRRATEEESIERASETSQAT